MTEEPTSQTRRGPATLEDVARHARVNKYTVSAVLNGFKSNTRVSEETRKRILQAVEELHYQPNAIARSLRRRRTGIIGVYNGTSPVYGRDPFSTMILEGLQRGSLQHSVDLLMHGRQPDPSSDGRGQMLTDGKVDGFVIAGFIEDPFVQWLIQKSIPAIAIADAIEGLPSIVVDDYKGGKMQAEHLATRGHKRVLYRTMPHILAPLGPKAIASMERRQQSFAQRAAELGIEVLIQNSKDDSGFVTEEETAFWLSSERPTAVVCCNDPYALRLIYFLNQNNIRVPDDVAVVGFDGLIPIVPYHYQLTTVHAPWTNVAERAVEMLLHVINKDASTLPPETTLPVQFVEGTTT